MAGGIDPNIILRAGQGIQPLQDPLERYGKSLALKNLMQQGDIQERAISDDEAMRQAYQQSGGDSARLRALLQQSGSYKGIQALDKSDLEKREKESTIGKNTAQAGKANFDVELKKIEHVSSALQAAKDNPQSWPAVRRILTIQFPEAAAKMPEQYDPQFIDAQIAQGQTLSQRMHQKLEESNKPFTSAGTPNEAVQAFELEKRKAGKPVTNVSVSTEKKYGEQFAGEIAKADVAMRDTAMKAPDLAQRANQIKQMLSSGKVITGTGADARLAIGKALNLAGASDEETIANTETLSTQLARNTLDAIKASGLGSGSGFSNADRDFLEKAVGGKINLQPETINRLAELAHKAADQSAKRWGQRSKQIPKDALQGTGIGTEAIEVPPLYSGASAAPAGLTQQDIDAELRRRGVTK